ncbi:MAG TPA: hypothetical protein VGL09_09730 [Methylomirabilota bacterium]
MSMHEASMPAFPVAAVDAAALRRRALWIMLLGKLLGSWGLAWDIRWHLTIGRDSFWIPPHLLTYLGVTMVALVSFGVLAVETWRERDGARAPGAVRIAGLTGTRGFHLAAGGIALTLAAAPVDDLWHRLFGIDVTLWSPPHLLGLAGGQVNAAGCLVIALEVPLARWARFVAVAGSAALLLGSLEVVADPAVPLAFVQGHAFFFAWAVLGALLFTFPLVLAARLTRARAFPLVVAAGVVVLYLVASKVADLGFALVQPVSVIDEAIAADPSSPIAIAHAMARFGRDRTPGRADALRWFTVVAALAVVAVDARRRPALAAAAFGAALVLVSGLSLARAPALAAARPEMVDVVLALVLAPLAAVGSARAATSVGPRLAPTVS